MSKRVCLVCSGRIPWHLKSNTKYCSPQCARRAKASNEREKRLAARRERARTQNPLLAARLDELEASQARHPTSTSR